MDICRCTICGIINKNPIVHTLFTKIPCVTTDQKVLDPEKPNIQTVADNQLISCCWYMRKSKRINYKMLSETGEKEEKADGQPEEVETVEVGEISNLLRSISISEDISEGLDQNGEEDDMEEQWIDAIKVELSTIADDTEDLIDENEIDESSTTSEVDCKISKIEELRIYYRKLHNELKILSGASYEELYGRYKERQLSSMKDYIKKGNNLKKYAAAKKSEADIKVNISKAISEMFLQGQF